MVRLKEKVIITVSKPRPYAPGIKDGILHKSVGFMARTYGQGSPCDTEEEVKKSIQWQKECVLKHGDIPIVKREDQETTLGAWI